MPAIHICLLRRIHQSLLADSEMLNLTGVVAGIRLWSRRFGWAARRGDLAKRARRDLSGDRVAAAAARWLLAFGG